MLKRETYPSDLSDAQLALIEPLVPGSTPGGRPLEYERRVVVNGILYLVRGLRLARAAARPATLPPLEPLLRRLVRGWHMAADRRGAAPAGGKPTPSATIIDSQCVKISVQGGPRGFDVAKQVVGRKRHVLVHRSKSLDSRCQLITFEQVEFLQVCLPEPLEDRSFAPKLETIIVGRAWAQPGDRLRVPLPARAQREEDRVRTLPVRPLRASREGGAEG